MRRRRRDRRVDEILDALDEVDVEPITPADLRIIGHALDDRIRMHAGTPAGEAALIVRTKIARLVQIARTK